MCDWYETKQIHEITKENNINVWAKKKEFQKAPKSSKGIKTHSILNPQNFNLQMFQKDLPKIILKQDHDLTKKLKIIKWKNQVLYIMNLQSTMYHMNH